MTKILSTEQCRTAWGGVLDEMIVAQSRDVMFPA
jgi:hypothetical protein